MLFSSAYATVMGVLPPLITDQTAVISDALNHSCIINAIALARPAEKHIYRHLDLGELERSLAAAAKTCTRAIVVTDGIFSMRGDHAPLDRIMGLARQYDAGFRKMSSWWSTIPTASARSAKPGAAPRNTRSPAPADILVATLGKAFGVNGGYVAGAETIVRYLRETSPFYIYSNPITPAEAAAAHAAVESGRRSGRARAAGASARHDGALQGRARGTGPRNAARRASGRSADAARYARAPRALVAHLRGRGILATGLNYPVVPKGEEEIRFQISADHVAADIDEALAALRGFGGLGGSSAMRQRCRPARRAARRAPSHRRSSA